MVPWVKRLKPRLPCATSIALQTVGVSTDFRILSSSAEMSGVLKMLRSLYGRYCNHFYRITDGSQAQRIAGANLQPLPKHMTHILQSSLPTEQREAAARPLPAMRPLDGQDWICVDSAYSQQLAEKAALLSARRDEVLACLPEAQNATSEALEHVLSLLAKRDDFQVSQTTVRQPDGQPVPLDRTAPLETVSRLIQEDICILQKDGDAHKLTAALLCFPASWTLSEKIGRALPTIHGPVATYDATIAKRVQRLFDGIRSGHPLWRANLLRYENAALYQPKSEEDTREPHVENPQFERSERQTLWRLPVSGAMVFSIHTTVVALRESPNFPKTP